MSFTVITNNSRTVNPDYEVKLSESRIMQKLVIGSLEKCLIHGKNRSHTLCGKSASKSYCVFFSNTDIKKSFLKKP